MPQPFNVRSQDKPGTDLGGWDALGNITIPGTLTAANVVNQGGSASGVQSVTNVDGTVTVTGTATAPVVSLSASQVATIAAKAPLASPTFTGTVATASATVSGQLVETPVTLTDAATIAVNAALGNTFRVVLSASGHVFGTPSNPVNGQKILLQIVQDGTGSRTISTWNSPWNFNTTCPQPTLSTGVNKRDYIGFVYDSNASKWDCLGIVLGN